VVTVDSYLDSDVRRGTSYTYALAALRDDGSEIRSAPASATTPSLALALEPNANPAGKAFQKAMFSQGIPLTAFEVSDLEQEYQRLKSLLQL